MCNCLHSTELKNVLIIRYVLNGSINTTKAIANSVVILLFTNSPINAYFFVRITSGISGRGIIRLRKTWPYTKIPSGSRPIRIAIVVGTTFTNRVMNRLSHTLTVFPNSPSIMACLTTSLRLMRQFRRKKSYAKTLEKNRGLWAMKNPMANN